VVDICALLQKEFAEAPMAVVGSVVEAEVIAKRIQRAAMREKEPDGANVSIVGAMLNEGDSVLVLVVGGHSARDEVEDQIRAAVSQFAQPTVKCRVIHGRPSAFDAIPKTYRRWRH
jgi:hypothetical protein